MRLSSAFASAHFSIIVATSASPTPLGEDEDDVSASVGAFGLVSMTRPFEPSAASTERFNEEVILCGFDMSEEYFYAHTKYDEIVNRYPSLSGKNRYANSISSDAPKVERLLEKIRDIEILFNKRGAVITQYKCNGKLSRILRHYAIAS